MNKKLFESKMKLYGDTVFTLAKYLGLSRATVSAKKNERKTEFTKSEIDKIRKRYNLSIEELNLIFFEDKVS